MCQRSFLTQDLTIFLALKPYKKEKIALAAFGAS